MPQQIPLNFLENKLPRVRRDLEEDLDEVIVDTKSLNSL